MSSLLLPIISAKHRSGSSSVTWNPFDKDASITLAGSNTIAQLSTSNRCVRANISHSSGKYYFRVRSSASGNASGCVGIANSSASLTARPGLNDANAWSHQSNGYKLYNGYSAYGVSWDTLNDELMVAIDFSTGDMWFGKNGVWMASGDPATAANPSFTGVSGTLFPICSSPAIYGPYVAMTFIYDTPPTGFTYW